MTTNLVEKYGLIIPDEECCPHCGVPIEEGDEHGILLESADGAKEPAVLCYIAPSERTRCGFLIRALGDEES